MTCSRNEQAASDVRQRKKSNWLKALFKEVPGQPSKLRCPLGHLVTVPDESHAKHVRLKTHLLKPFICGWLDTQEARELDEPTVKKAVVEWDLADEANGKKGEDEDDFYEPPNIKKGRGRYISIKMLLETDTVGLGDLVHAKCNADATGVITADGRILYRGKTFAPTSFLEIITEEMTGMNVTSTRSGWDEIVCKGKTLRELLTTSQKQKSLVSGSGRRTAGVSGRFSEEENGHAVKETVQKEKVRTRKRGRPPGTGKPQHTRPSPETVPEYNAQEQAGHKAPDNGFLKRRSSLLPRDPRLGLIPESPPFRKRPRSSEAEELGVHHDSHRRRNGLCHDVLPHQQQLSPCPQGSEAHSEEECETEPESSGTESHGEEDGHLREGTEEDKNCRDDEGRQEDMEENENACLETSQFSDDEDPLHLMKEEDLSFKLPAGSYIILCKACGRLLTDSTAAVGSLASLDMLLFSGARWFLTEAKPKLIRHPLCEARALSCDCGASLGLRFGNPEGAHAAIADCYGLDKGSIARHCLGDLGSRCDYSRPFRPQSTLANQALDSNTIAERTRRM